MAWSFLDDDAARRAGLEREVQTELAPGHPLYGSELTAIAARDDTDDVVFRIEGEPLRFAVVHLTWSGAPERSPDWPSSFAFSSLDEALSVTSDSESG